MAIEVCVTAQSYVILFEGKHGGLEAVRTGYGAIVEFATLRSASEYAAAHCGGLRGVRIGGLQLELFEAENLVDKC